MIPFSINDFGTDASFAYTRIAFTFFLTGVWTPGSRSFALVSVLALGRLRSICAEKAILKP